MNTYTTPYAYVISWTKFNRSYFGVCYAEGSNPHQLMKSVFPNSFYFDQMVRRNGKPDVVSIIKTFADKNSCNNFRSEFLERVSPEDRKRWLNFAKEFDANRFLNRDGALRRKVSK